MRNSKEILDRVSLKYFGGSDYWEILIDGNVVATRDTKEEADFFIARLLLELTT